MKRIVLVCNASGGVKEALEKHRDSFLNSGDYLSVFRDPNITDISSRIFSSYISTNPVADYDACAVVFVINGSDVVLDNFRVQFPGAIFLSAPFHFTRAYKKQYIQLIGFLKRELVHVRKLVNALRKEFSERDSRTPLLLPLRNFRSAVLNDLLIDVQKLRPAEDDYNVPLRRLIDSKGLSSVRERKNRTFFENRNSIRFYGPSKAGARHGIPAYRAPHNFGCTVNAFFRLGARYDVKFHYDCQYAQGHISGIFPNCHDVDESCSSRTHLNISPNDFIR